MISHSTLAPGPTNPKSTDGRSASASWQVSANTAAAHSVHIPSAGDAELALSTEAFEVSVRDYSAPTPHAPLLNATATLNTVAARYLALLPITAAGDLHIDVTFAGTSLAGFPKAVSVYPGAISAAASSIAARPARVGTDVELRLAVQDEFGNLVRRTAPRCSLGWYCIVLSCSVELCFSAGGSLLRVLVLRQRLFCCAQASATLGHYLCVVA